MFRGGVHPLSRIHEGKGLTRGVPIREEVPQTVIIPMVQNIGAYAKPCVAAGDSVKLGQLIGEPQGYVSAPIHASVSGRVSAVEPRPHVSGVHVMSVVIENDGLDTKHESVVPVGSIDSLSPEQIKAAILDAGIVGMGGATFPTHVKLNIPEGKSVDILLINGAECEPYLSADHRLMLERPTGVAQGMRALMKALGVQKAIIGIEDNKKDAVQAIRKAIEGIPGGEVVELPTKYPQGAEKQLIYMLTGREVPSGKLPTDAGVVCVNVGTAAALMSKLESGLPLIKRMVTVTGAVEKPANLLLRIGTTFEDAIGFCGGYKGKPGKLISGGPMMGFPVFNAQAAVTKGTSGILVLSEADAKPRVESNCIRCGRCVNRCPIGLIPFTLATAYERDRIDICQAEHAMDCIECGCCSFVCPANRRLTQAIKLSKRSIQTAAKK